MAQEQNPADGMRAGVHGAELVQPFELAKKCNTLRVSLRVKKVVVNTARNYIKTCTSLVEERQCIRSLQGSKKLLYCKMSPLRRSNQCG